MRIKQQATILQKKLFENFSLKIGHIEALNLMSQTWGYDDWHHASREKKKRDSVRASIPAPKPPRPHLDESHYAIYSALKQNGQWEQSQALAKIICGIYDKCNLLIHKENNKYPLQPSFGKIMWDEFFNPLKKMFTILGDMPNDEQEELLNTACGIYTSIEEYHSLYKLLFSGRTQPFANILIWKDPENGNQLYQDVKDIEAHLNAEIAICYTIASRSGASSGDDSIANMMFFLRHGEV
jgi:hypothetical protein